MTKRVSRLQTGVGLGLLVIGTGIFAFHAIRHGGTGGFGVKAALGVAGVGLLLLPFDYSKAREALRLWRERKESGGDGKVSGGKSE